MLLLKHLSSEMCGHRAEKLEQNWASAFCEANQVAGDLSTVRLTISEAKSAPTCLRYPPQVSCKMSGLVGYGSSDEDEETSRAADNTSEVRSQSIRFPFHPLTDCIDPRHLRAQTSTI